MTPIRNEILFKPFPSDEFSMGGIFVPLSAREISDRGTIIKTGRGTEKKPMKLKVGMIAHRVKNWGQEVIIDNELYFLMDASAILAVE